MVVTTDSHKRSRTLRIESISKAGEIFDVGRVWIDHCSQLEIDFASNTFGSHIQFRLVWVVWCVGIRLLNGDRFFMFDWKSEDWCWLWTLDLLTSIDISRWMVDWVYLTVEWVWLPVGGYKLDFGVEWSTVGKTWE